MGDAHERAVCVALGGGAWASLSYLGIVQYLQRTFDSVILESWAFCGESAGALFALALCLGIPCEALQRFTEALVHDVNAHPLGTAGCLELAVVLLERVLEWVSEEELVRRLKGRFAGAQRQCPAYELAEFFAFHFRSGNPAPINCPLLTVCAFALPACSHFCGFGARCRVRAVHCH